MGRQMDTTRVWKEQVTPGPQSHPSPIYESPLSGAVGSLQESPCSEGPPCPWGRTELASSFAASCRHERSAHLCPDSGLPHSAGQGWREDPM